MAEDTRVVDEITNKLTKATSIIQMSTDYAPQCT